MRMCQMMDKVLMLGRAPIVRNDSERVAATGQSQLISLGKWHICQTVLL